MPRIRTLKPEFWTDRKLARLLTRDERMLYMGLWNQCDEHSRALGDPSVIKGQIFPYETDLTVPAVAEMLDKLVREGVVFRYVVGGDPYLYLPNLSRHQALQPYRVKSRIPAPPDSLYVVQTLRVASSVQKDRKVFDTSDSPSTSDSEGLLLRQGKSVRCTDFPGRDSSPFIHLKIKDLKDLKDLVHPDEPHERADPSPALFDLPAALSAPDPPGVDESPPTPSRSPSVATRGRKRASASEPSDEFLAFWAVYPRREARAAAVRAFRHVMDSGRVPLAELIAAAQRYADRPDREPRYTALASTWLNGDRWLDEPEAPRPKLSRREQALAEAEQYKTLGDMGITQLPKRGD
jgi:DNA-binding Lrp family transcriptional regulator